MDVSHITLVKPISISLSLVVEEFKVAECRLMAPKENQKMTWQPEQRSTYACK